MEKNTPRTSTETEPLNGSAVKEAITPDQRLQKFLREIDACLSRGVLPVHNDHLKGLCEEGDVLEYLLFIKQQGLISGDLVTKGANSTPYRMTNIRLTYAGIRMLRSCLDAQG
jgi:hypothetical protein